MPTWQVPITLYFMTHAYFCLYHALSNVLLRRLGHATARWPRAMQLLAAAALIFSLSYATAFMETLTISHFPYYTFKVTVTKRKMLPFIMARVIFRLSKFIWSACLRLEFGRVDSFVPRSGKFSFKVSGLIVCSRPALTRTGAQNLRH